MDNIRLGWMCLTATNTLAYYKTDLTTAVESFITQVPGFKSDVLGL